jgi:hypothetical protein
VLVEVGCDDGIADLREQLAAEAVLLSVEALEGEELRSSGGFHYERIDFTGADRPQHLFRFLQTRAQHRVFGEKRFVGGGYRFYLHYNLRNLVSHPSPADPARAGCVRSSTCRQ